MKTLKTLIRAFELCQAESLPIEVKDAIKKSLAEVSIYEFDVEELLNRERHSQPQPLFTTIYTKEFFKPNAAEQDFINKRDRVNAIKAYCERTGMGLLESKYVIDGYFQQYT